MRKFLHNGLTAPRRRQQGPGYFYRACSVDCAKRRLSSSYGTADRFHAKLALAAELKIKRPRKRLVTALRKFIDSNDASLEASKQGPK